LSSCFQAVEVPLSNCACRAPQIDPQDEVGHPIPGGKCGRHFGRIEATRGRRHDLLRDCLRRRRNLDEADGPCRKISRNLPVSCDVTRYDSRPARCSLEQRESERLGDRQAHDDIRGTEPSIKRGIGYLPGELDPLPDTSLSGEGFQAYPLRTIADDYEAVIRAPDEPSAYLDGRPVILLGRFGGDG